VEDDTVVPLPRPGAAVEADPLLAVLREGARRMLTQAIEAEVEAFLAAHAAASGKGSVGAAQDRGRTLRPSLPRPTAYRKSRPRNGRPSTTAATTTAMATSDQSAAEVPRAPPRGPPGERTAAWGNFNRAEPELQPRGRGLPHDLRLSATRKMARCRAQ
jgi:hypothetical protein